MTSIWGISSANNWGPKYTADRRLSLCRGGGFSSATATRSIVVTTATACCASYCTTPWRPRWSRSSPPSLVLSIRERLQRASRAGYQAKLQRWDYRAIVRTFARTLREKGCDGLVTGHFHLAYCEQLDDSSFSILSLGEWLGQYTYGEISAGELSLHSYQASLPE